MVSQLRHRAQSVSSHNLARDTQHCSMPYSPFGTLGYLLLHFMLKSVAVVLCTWRVSGKQEFPSYSIACSRYTAHEPGTGGYNNLQTEELSGQVL